MAKKVLIIDDDEAIVESLKVLLTIKGYETETACDGEDGVCKARDMHPDIILLDMLLPGHDGYEVYRELRKENVTPASRVIFLSSFSGRPDLKTGEGLENEITLDMFMPKPVDPKKLLDLLASM